VTPTKIFLTGFMGCGKTTLGKKLAALMALDFIDLDQYIEHQQQHSISWIFEHRGEPAFREMEKNSLDEIIKTRPAFVLSLGGGTLLDADNVDLVKTSGFLVYIQMSSAMLTARLSRTSEDRPLLKGLKGDALAAFIRDKLKVREQYYRQAHITVNGLNLTPKLLYNRIFEALRENTF
jgi:shikimate kinase